MAPVATILAVAAVFAAAVSAAPKADLRAGAARIDITPGKDESLMMSGYAARNTGHKGVGDNIHVRAIVLDNGAARAALVTIEVVSLSHDFWERMSRHSADETGIPRESMLLAATHTHSAPSLGGFRGSELPPHQAKYVQRVEQAIVSALKNAVANLRPARIGAGSGKANVNVNRVARFADGSYYLGINPEAPSDKTVAVVKIETRTGEPLALFINYGVHGTGMGQENYLISGDVPGATSRYVEKAFGDRIVAAWTSGAGGDQCPIYDRAATRFAGVDAVGMLLGEEVVRVAKSIDTTGTADIHAAQRVVTCAGHRLTPGPRVREKYEWTEAESVPIRLSLLRINDIAITGVSGEVLTMIGQRLKRESKRSNTVMVTHCNGSSGYLPDDASYARIGYEIQTARVKPGCAEKAIVQGLLEMIRQSR
jgi:hypothetical protein